MAREAFIARLREIAGGDAVRTDPESLLYYSLDLSEQRGELPVAVVRPATVEQIARIVETAGASGFHVNTRGGGVSYTRSHVPVNDRTIILDIRALNRILEINLRDRYITMETGTTWYEVREALKDTGFRIPYQGTYSGRISTVGGGLSQNATGLGRGTLAEFVLGLEVVLGDGKIIQTGSSAVSGTPPFYRYNGPDYTGLFLCDSGAYGIKTKVTLLLEPVPQTAFGCFAFDSYVDLVATQAAIIEAGHFIESFGWGANFLKALADSPVPTFKEQLALCREHLARSPDKPRALRALWRAWSPRGLGYLRDLYAAMYVMTEAYSQADADRMMADITRIARRRGGRVLPSTLGFGARFGPFPYIAKMLYSPLQEIWFPVNGKFPVSKAVESVKLLEVFKAEHRETMEKYGIRMESNFLTHGYFCGVEPVLYWKRPSPYRERFGRNGDAVPLDIPPVDETSLKVFELRRDLTRRLRDLGALHLQWGKMYPYRDSLREDVGHFVDDLKRTVDPNNVLNPGILGLGLQDETGNASRGAAWN